jgi:hypothetical protein
MDILGIMKRKVSAMYVVVSGDVIGDRPSGGVDRALRIQAVLAELEMTSLPDHNVYVDRGKGVVT